MHCQEILRRLRRGPSNSPSPTLSEHISRVAWDKLVRMNSRSLSIQAPKQFIESLIQMEIEGVRSGLPVPASSTVDLLDAPMNRKKLVGHLQVVTLLLSTATAGVKLAEEVGKFLKDNPGIVITIRDAITGTSVGKFDSNTPPEKLVELLKI